MNAFWKKWMFNEDVPYEQLGVLGRTGRVLVISLRLFFGGGYARQATALTYYTVFALVPLLALCFGIAKGFALENLLKQQLTAHFSHQQELLDWLFHFVNTTLQQARGGLIAGIGVILLFVTVVSLASNVEDTFNLIWGLPRRRNLLRKISAYLTILLLTPILLIVLGSAAPVTRGLLQKLGASLPLLQFGGDLLLQCATRGLPVVISCLLFTGIYFFVPNTRVKFRSALFAGVIGGTLFQLFQASLLYLGVAVSKYNTIYGSFAAVPLLLIWLHLSWKITLFGAELGFVHQNAGSGRFDDGQTQCRRVRRRYLYALVRLVAARFAAGDGLTDEETIIRTLRISRFRCLDYLEELIGCGILLPATAPNGGSGCVPAFSPETLTPARVQELLDDAGGKPADDFSDPELAPVDDLCRKLDAAAAASPDNRPLKDL